MSRRSQRSQAGQSSFHTDAGLTRPRVESREVINSTKETRKKRKLGHDARNTRKKGPKLQSMLDMPLDIVLEICSYLHPKDLLHLARSTKELRAFFMSKKSLQFWKAARATVTNPLLPPCPSDLSEPVYANLMFDTHCHNCLKPNCQDVYLTCRVRLCRSCYEKLSIPIDDCSVIIAPETQQMIRPFVLTDMLPILQMECHYGDSFYVPMLESFLSELESVPQKKLAKYLASRKKLILSRKKISPLSNFLYNSKTSRLAEIENIRKKRKQDIFKRLREGGYGEELDWMARRSIRPMCLPRFDKVPGVRKAQALTDRVWENIREPIIKYMADIRERRLDDNRKTALAERLSLVNDVLKDFVTPHRTREYLLALAIFIPEVYNRIQLSVSEVDVTELRCFLKDSMPTYLEKTETKDSFVAQTRERFHLDESVDPLKLALAAWFTCPHCHSSERLPYALHHLCYSSSAPKPGGLSREDFVLIECAFLRVHWGFELPVPMNIVTADGTKQSESVIEACGSNVKTATADELDKADIWLQCLSHNSAGPGIPIMNWRTAAQHHCGDSGPPAFARATEEQVSAATPLWDEADLMSKHDWQKDGEFSCTHCTEFVGGDAGTLVNHLRNIHNVPDITKDDWVDGHRGVRVRRPVYLVSRHEEVDEMWIQRFGRIARVRAVVDF